MLDLAVNWAQDLATASAGARLLLPEMILVAVGCIAILLDLLIPRERSGPTLAWVALMGTFAALAFSWDQFRGTEATSVFWGAVSVDRFAAFFKIIILFGTIFSIVLVHESRELRGRSMGEFYGLLFCAVAGMCLMVGATEFVTTFLAIELVSIPSFALVAYVRRDRHGTEAAIKYVLYSAFATGLMLFGLSIIYGLTGSTSFARTSQFLVGTTGVTTMTVGVACLLAFAGFAFKMSAAPFHFWAPDVYQGAPTPVTAWLSVTSKAAGIGLFMRFLLSFMSFNVSTDRGIEGSLSVAGFDWVSALIVISAITMTIGNFGALFQTSMKRLLAYSSVAHVGYMLMGIAAIQAIPASSTVVAPVAISLGLPGDGMNGGAATVFYMTAYLFMNLGAFGCVVAVSNVTGSDDLSSFRALGRRAPILALALAVFAFALIGIPPTAGFVGKFQLFMATIERAQVTQRSGFWWLVAIGGLNSVVAVYYYLKIAKVMYLDGTLDPDAREPLPVSPALTFVCAFLMIPVIGLGLFFGRIVDYANSLELLRS